MNGPWRASPASRMPFNIKNKHDDFQTSITLLDGAYSVY